MSTYSKIWEHAKRRTGQTNITDAVGIEYIDFAIDDYSNLVAKADGRWKFDGLENSDTPDAYAAAVSGQNRYELDTNFLQIDQVHFKTSDGTWKVLEAVDSREYQDKPLDQVYSTAGTPKVFDYDGNAIRLYPAPDFSDSGDLTNTANLSIRVRHTRPVDYLGALADTLNISRTHSPYLVAHLCYQIATATNDPSVTNFQQELMKQEKAVIEHLSMRDEAAAHRLKPITSSAFNRFRRS